MMKPCGQTSWVLVLDIGSAYTGALVRMIRELGVVCELCPADSMNKLDESHLPTGVVICGGMEMLVDGMTMSLEFMESCRENNIPILSISYGMVAVCGAFGVNLSIVKSCDYKPNKFVLLTYNKLFDNLPSTFQVFSNVDNPIVDIPSGFISLGSIFTLTGLPVGISGSLYNGKYNLYCIFFHPECVDTEYGTKLLSNFLFNICNCEKLWTMENYLKEILNFVKIKCGNDKYVVGGVSGGVDSTVCASILHSVIGNRFHGVMIDTGLMRHNEIEDCYNRLKKEIPELNGISDPEQKRKIIGRVYIEEFESVISEFGYNQNNCLLLQGTIYPDILESSLHKINKLPIKSHHNVGGLPSNMKLELIEPVRYLFKEEVRTLGRLLNLSNETVNRQPFPGPGLGIRVIGDLTPERVHLVRAADKILREEFTSYLQQNPTIKVSQYFCVLLPNTKSTGIINGQRVYGYTVVIRAIFTFDFVTAKWCVVSPKLLKDISTRITNEIDGINRVCYDITDKGPATIEWE